MQTDLLIFNYCLNSFDIRVLDIRPSKLLNMFFIYNSESFMPNLFLV
jgi:hypothetical protein